MASDKYKKHVYTFEFKCGCIMTGTAADFAGITQNQDQRLYNAQRMAKGQKERYWYARRAKN